MFLSDITCQLKLGKHISKLPLLMQISVNSHGQGKAEEKIDLFSKTGMT